MSGATVDVGATLGPADVVRVAVGQALIRIPSAVAARVEANRQTLDDAIDGGAPLYGITTGFGALVRERVPAGAAERAQVNLLRSHAAGTGNALPREVVRAAMTVRLNSLALGHSGVRPELLAYLAAMINSELVPCVPRTGSLGASGDLAPSAHAFLPIIGEGTAEDAHGQRLTGAQTLARLERPALRLQPKEALALINGTHFMSGVGALVAVRARRALDTADAVAAVTLDALEASAAALDPRVHSLRGLAGQMTSAANLRAMLAGSRRLIASGDGGRVQDAYSLRCAAQVHGAARETTRFFDGILMPELNAVTDNPLVFDEAPHVVSAGNFHGQALAVAFDALRLSLADLASISERRTFRLLSPSAGHGLPAFLTREPGVASGYMVAQYTAAALLAELRALAHPVSVDSVPTSDNQEDHVSMGMTAALMTVDALERLETVFAIELLCACQALDARPGAPPGHGTVQLHAAVRERVPELTDDRPPAADIEQLENLIRHGAAADVLQAQGISGDHEPLAAVVGQHPAASSPPSPRPSH